LERSGSEVCVEGRKVCVEGRKVCVEGRKVCVEGRKVCFFFYLFRVYYLAKLGYYENLHRMKRKVLQTHYPKAKGGKTLCP